MTKFMEYVLGEVSSRRLRKADALEVLREFQQGASVPSDVLHPLLHENTSDLEEERFSSAFSGEEFYLADHRVRGERVLPGVAYLEMARAAFEQAAGSPKSGPVASLRIRNAVWAKPFCVGNESKQLHVCIFPLEAGAAGYEVYSSSSLEGGCDVHSQGSTDWVYLQDSERTTSAPLQTLREQCRQQLKGDQLYEVFQRIGIEYGPAHRGVGHVSMGTDDQGKRYVIASLQLPSVVAHTHEEYVLHPTLLDSALHASLGLTVDEGAGSAQLMLPYALEELTVLGRCPAHAYAWIREAAGSSAKVHKLDIDLCDEDGKVYVQVRGFSARVLEGGSAEAGAVQEAQPVVEAQELMRFEEHWQEQPLSGGRAGGRAALVCFVDTQAAQEQVLQVLREQHLGPVVFIGRDHQYTCTDGTHYGIRAGQVEDYASALRTIVQEHGTPEAVLYLWAVQEQEPVGQCTELVRLVQALGREQVNCARVLVAGNGRDELEQAQVQSWHGFMRSLRPVLPHGWMSVVGEQSASASSIGEWSRRLWAELGAERAQAVRYEGDRRQVSVMREVSWAEEAGEGVAGLRRGGTYLITGGAGGLGLVFARYLARRYAANLILTGRAPLEEGRRGQLRELEELGSQVLYVSADVCDEAQMSAVVREGLGAYGTIHGVIHAAGVAARRNILEKEISEFEETIAAKIAGTLVLDRVLAQCSVDFICYFSSSSAVLGDFGSCDYSIGNRFQHAHAVTSHSGPRRVSIAWPLWREGGMQVGDAQQTQAYLETSGLRLLETEEGLEAFEQVLARGVRQQLVLAGHPSRIRRSLGVQSVQNRGVAAAAATPAPASVDAGAEQTSITTAADSDELSQRTLQYLKRLLAGSLKLDADRIEEEGSFERYGIDSVLVMQMTNELEKSFGSLPKTLFFEYQTLRELSGYFLRRHADRLQQLVGAGKEGGGRPVSAVVPGVDGGARKPRAGRARGRWRGRPPAAAEAPAVVAEGQEIAIIGLSGRYPQARNVWEFWENLKAGRDSITEIPAERWDYRAYFDPQKGTLGKSYSKWGGFLDGVAEFDPLFFNISPREAEMLDPQERLFLQCVYETVEDAGYTRESLGHHRSQGLEGNVGVFVGVMYEEYQLYGAQAQALGQPLGLISTPASIANRVSYFFNWHGPSMAVDTMCSSSLTAIHLACQSLQRGGCEVAIAGGVNVSVHPNKYLALSQGQFCSSQGRCESFGEGGDGYVPGEGVGAVLLKPLWRARQDGDQIYGVIKASAINHGGKTNGYSVPNPVAQSQVVSQCLKSLDVPVRAISYVEAHGTGTSLGDPIEVAGLSRAFEAHTGEKQFCALGSAKSNIGHCESAAGIAGITKVLLQMKHRTLVPSLHSRVLNPHIDFADTPFVVQQQLGAWTRPVLKEDAGLREYPLLAGVSSFGAGGANAHVILQEYVQEGPSAELGTGPALVVLSGSSEAVLQEQARRLLQWIQEQGLQESQLGSLAYTLQVGREALEHRVGMRVRTLEQLKERLGRYVAGERGIEDVYRGEVKRNKEALSSFATDEDLQAALGAWLEKGKYGKLLELWVKGLAVQWSRLYAGSPPRRMSLPTYPFAKERFWIPGGMLESVLSQARRPGAAPLAVLHPLVQHNTSVLGEQRFSSVFSGEEFYLADHRVRGERVLPGVAYLEMARAALEQADATNLRYQRLHLRHVVWARPYSVNGTPRPLHIGLYPLESGEIEFEVYGAAGGGDSDPDDGEREVHSQGSAIFESPDDDPVILPLQVLQQRCDKQVTAEHCYAVYRHIGLEYGAAHQGVRHVRVGEDERGARFVLAELQLPQVVSETHTQFVLHPTLLDSALHASLAMRLVDAGSAEGPGRPMLPYALEELTVLGRCPAHAYAWIREAAGSSAKVHKLDIDLCDEDGKVYVQVRGFSARVLEGGSAEAGAVQEAQPVVEAQELMRFEEHWQEQPLSGGRAGGRAALVCFVDTQAAQEQVLQVLREQHLGPVVFIGRDHQYTCTDGTHYGIRAGQVEDYASALRTIVQEHGTPEAVLYLWAVQEQEPVGQCTELVRLVQALGREQVNCARVLVAGNGRDELEQAQVQSWHGFMRSLRPVLPHGWMSVVGEQSASASSIGEWSRRLWAELGAERAQAVRYEGDRRQVSVMREVSWAEEAGEGVAGLRRGGTYLITGGAGGLGLVFARYLARRYAANLILTGRAPLEEGRRGQLRELEELGSQVLYVSADVCDEAQMSAVVREGLGAYGTIHGVIHAAGVAARRNILEKEISEFEETIAAKIAGTLVLDRVLAQCSVDFICYFSSSSAVLGDFGSCDYSIGNRFQHAHAVTSHSGPRRVSIAWPLWREGGMQVGDAQQTQAYLETSGLRLLETEEGLEAFEQVLARGVRQQLVLAGHPSRIRRSLGVQSVQNTRIIAPSAAPAAPAADLALPRDKHPLATSTLAERTILLLKRLLSGNINLSVDRIEEDAPLERYGIDSVMSMQMTDELENSFGPLSKTLFFEYQTLRELRDYFLRSHSDELMQLLGAQEPAALVVSGAADIPPSAGSQANPYRESDGSGPASPAPFRKSRKRRRAGPQAPSSTQGARATSQHSPDIAIISMSGRYPQARSVNEYWENLKAGKDCIVEVPKDRWDHSDFFDVQKGAPGKTYSKWGGFIDGVEEFDPLFFNIAPREAERMDPQERLLLETVWNLLESAGHTRDLIQTRYKSKVGVYVGSMYHQYGSISSQSGIANRLSYFFGLQGPSIAVDTMCSSAAVAIHMACADLRNGECGLAIAGGVNLTSHPAKYLHLSQKQLLASDPERRSFSNGDGYIPAEAVGVVLLKPLQSAIDDGDEIVAVIKNTKINHGGRSNGYSVPNLHAQAQLMEENLVQAGILPASIGYVEAAALGSAVGDAIELAALQKVFSSRAADSARCAIGSVKSNIGHAEAASGMSQIMKVALQLKHRQLVPSIKASAEGASATFANTAFALQHRLQEWSAPSGNGSRRALINSFGAGGSNASLILEEYRAKPDNPEVAPEAAPDLFLFSAKTAAQLPTLARDIANHASADPRIRLSDVAHTLRVGREEMPYRLAVLASSREELAAAVAAFSDGNATGQSRDSWRVLTADANGDPIIRALTSDRPGQAYIDALFAESNWQRLAEIWVRGGKIDWAVRKNHAMRIVALPTYPFSREYSFPVLMAPPAAEAGLAPTTRASDPPPTAIAEPVLLTADGSGTWPGLPQTAFEKTIAKILEDALGAREIRVGDNFLELGGDSLSGRQVISRLSEMFGVELPVDALIGEHATVGGLAVAIVSELARQDVEIESMSITESESAQSESTRVLVETGEYAP